MSDVNVYGVPIPVAARKLRSTPNFAPAARRPRQDRRLLGAVCAAAGLAAICMLAAMLVGATPATLAAAPGVGDSHKSVRATSAVTLDQFVFLPLIAGGISTNACQGIASEIYSSISVNPPATDRPADQHADLNHGLRGYTSTSAFLGLVNTNGSADGNAPQFAGFFRDNRTPEFTSADRVYNWNWACNCATTPISSPAVTLLGLGTAAGEIIDVPASGYNIGNGYEVLVLYAAPARITLKYTRDDNVINGYTIHVEDVCVEPSLLALYQAANAAGRGQLPALRAGQAFGRTVGGSIRVAVQDAGAWLDPRSRKDWWQGR